MQSRNEIIVIGVRQLKRLEDETQKLQAEIEASTGSYPPQLDRIIERANDFIDRLQTAEGEKLVDLKYKQEDYCYIIDESLRGVRARAGYF
jgi:hypothetical protein